MKELLRDMMILLLILTLGILLFVITMTVHVDKENINDSAKAINDTTTKSIYSDYFPEWEVTEIQDACYRNNLEPQLVPIMYAIRKAENGRPGLEFGIMNPEADTYSKQAGWAVCTVQKNYDRWLKDNQDKEYIDYLGDRYCPAEVDPEGNVNWKKNVKYWTNKFNEKEGE